MSERLTEKGTVAFDTILEQGEYDIVKQYMKLQHYEDMAEQGKLITLPCAVGQILYAILNGHIHKFQYEYESDIVFDMRKDDKFGKTVFLTESEAQQVLEKISGGENE